MRLKEYFSNLFPNKDILFTSSGRSAFQALIEDLKLEDTKMLIQSFICKEVFLPLLKSNNISPIFIDSGKNNFNISLKDIKKASRNKKPSSLLLVHTFGKTNEEIDKISEWCKKNKIHLIEDCAHCLNLKFKGKQLGSFGIASVFSFPKTLKKISGGAYVKNNGEIKIKPEKYKINSLDIARLSYKIPFRELIMKPLRLFKKNNSQNYGKIKIIEMPFFANKINEKYTNLEKRKQKTLEIYNQLKNKYNIKLEKENNFFQSIPLLVSPEKRESVFKELSKKYKCEKLWTSCFKGKKSEFYSKRIINILISTSF